MVKGGFVYLLASGRNGTLYLGVTSDLTRRMAQHRQKTLGGFTARYSVERLVWFEALPTIEDAIAAEKTMKKWRRAWKIALIESTNPEWRNLADDVMG
jgi:putative endonuclease